MIDSHCHLDHEPLFNNLQKILNRSKKNGITKLLTISTNFKSFKKIIDLVNIDPMIFGTFGIHPHETSTDLVTKDIIIKNINGNKKVIGVGETGLDFYYNHSEKEKQITSFKAHIEAAINLDVPLIVHSRNAETETFDILNLYKKDQPKILMHCFAGSKSFVNKLATLNSFFSASGIITFKNSTELQNTFKDIPQNFLATRYHSLIVEESSLPDNININATAKDKYIMSISIPTSKAYGLQFHPESYDTEVGYKLINNFINICETK